MQVLQNIKKEIMWSQKFCEFSQKLSIPPPPQIHTKKTKNFLISLSPQFKNSTPPTKKKHFASMTWVPIAIALLIRVV
jgi:hypothetical protein